MFWHRHFDITLVLAAIAMMSLQTPVRPPDLQHTSERSLSAVIESSTGAIEVPRMFVSPPALSIESRVLQMAPVAASVALGATESELAASNFASHSNDRSDEIAEFGSQTEQLQERSMMLPAVADKPSPPQEIATPLYAM